MKKKSVSKKETPIKEPEKELVWGRVRISFCLMIGLWILFAIMQFVQGDSTAEPGLLFSILSRLWITITIFNFITSIIHLTKYKEKAFAIASLVFSSILMLLFLIGLVIGGAY